MSSRTARATQRNLVLKKKKKKKKKTQKPNQTKQTKNQKTKKVTNALKNEHSTLYRQHG
jgi:hypothetical protein